MFYKQILYPIIQSIDKFSNRDAFCINNTFYTYKEFGEIISSIQSAIHSLNTQSRNIGLVANNDIETYASVIALWLEGYGYVPLHLNWPRNRCENIIQQVQMEVILDSSRETQFSDRMVIKTCGIKNSTVERLSPINAIDDNCNAYILFTSGSTGVPKGVPISRSNLAAFCNAFWDIGFSLSENDRFLQCFDLTFDLSVTSYLMPLLVGACCYTVPNNVIKYTYIYQLMELHNLTFMLMSPSTIRYLQPYFEEINCPSVRYSLFCGEALHTDITKQWSKCVPQARIFNVYGPTEDTIYCTYYEYSRTGNNKDNNGVLSIGKTMTSGEAQVINDNGDICKAYEKGELCLRGKQLFSSYWKNEEKTQKAFFFANDGERYYRSGDLCYVDKDGDVMYSGRIDYQIKIQGFRVEMGEIEYNAREYLGGADVVCMAYDNSRGLKEIAMFVESKVIPTDKLIEYMKSKMPSYMIPSKIVFINTFELNSNGKIDMNKLKYYIENK